MFYIFLIVVILLFPIPLKIKLVFNNNTLKVFVFKKEFNINKIIKKKLKHKKNNTLKETKKNSHKSISKKKFLNININNFFKPTLKIDLKINFGFNDAAYTAITYGFLSIAPGFIYNILTKFFKIKKYKFNLQPVFNNEFIYIEISSIFFVNLVKVIYIAFKIFIIYIKEKSLSHSKIQRSGTIG